MSARDATRRWSLARFAAVGRELLLRKGGTVVLLGEAGEWPEIDGVAREIGQACLNLAGKTSLPVLGGVIARLSVLVTNDSGPAHIAYALGTPTATIFGGGNPEANGPPLNARHRVLAYEVPCRPCGLATCPIGYRCLEGVTVAAGRGDRDSSYALAFSKTENKNRISLLSHLPASLPRLSSAYVYVEYAPAL